MTSFLRSNSDSGTQKASLDFNPSHQEYSDTSDFASISKRSILNNSMTNFFPDLKNKKKEIKLGTSYQQGINEIQNNNAEAESFSFTFYSTKNKSLREDQPEFGNNCLPAIGKSKELETSASSSIGFKLDDSMMKKGVTLDKLFGGEFKKIDIFDTRKRSAVETQNIFPDPEGEFETNREDKHKYESFEIAETENEEDIENAPDPLEKTFNKQKETMQTIDGVKATQILQRIQSKYKRSKSKSLQRKKLQGFVDPESILSDVNDVNKIVKESKFYEDKTESQSLSPKFKQERSNPKLYRTRIGKVKNSMNRIENDSFEESQSNYNKKNLTSQTIYYGHKKNKGLTSSVTLGDVRDIIGPETSKMAIIRTKKAIIKKSLASLNPNFLVEHENVQESHNALPTMPASKSSGLMSIIKSNASFVTANSNSNQSTGLKPEEISSFKKRLARENKLIADRIKVNEKEKMERYSKLFKLNKKEKINLYDGDNSMKGETQRNSTPLNDIQIDKFFERKKLMNF